MSKIPAISLLALVAAASALSPARADDEWTPSDEERAVYDALSVRHTPPSCEAVEALATDPVDTLQVMVERAIQPPWVGVRAADCLITRHADEIAPVLETWVSEPEYLGLALVTLGKLDGMSPEVAEGVAKAALAGPLSEEAIPRIAAAESERLRALVAPAE